MKPIEVFILTGYLGAGKTTTLNNLLQLPRFKDRQIALIINEFGKMGVDGALIEPGSYQKYEINKGSVFCICTKTDFLKVMSDISKTGVADTVIIEATGIAEVADIESLLTEPALDNRFKVKANICIVDAVNFTKTAPFLRAVTSQVRAADGIIINKTDLVKEEAITRLSAVLKYINKKATLTIGSHGSIKQDFIDKLDHSCNGKKLIVNPPEEMIAVSFQNDHSVRREEFEEVLSELYDSLVRFKGNVNFKSGSKFVEIVFGDKTENDTVSQLKSANSFTAIAWRISREQLKSKFDRLWSEEGKRRIINLKGKAMQTDPMQYIVLH